MPSSTLDLTPTERLLLHGGRVVATGLLFAGCVSHMTMPPNLIEHGYVYPLDGGLPRATWPCNNFSKKCQSRYIPNSTMGVAPYKVANIQIVADEEFDITFPLFGRLQRRLVSGRISLNFEINSPEGPWRVECLWAKSETRKVFDPFECSTGDTYYVRNSIAASPDVAGTCGVTMRHRWRSVWSDRASKKRRCSPISGRAGDV